MTWIDWMVHGIAILILAGCFGGPFAWEEGDYRLVFFIFLAAGCAWGWYCEYEKRQNWERFYKARHDPELRSTSWFLDP